MQSCYSVYFSGKRSQQYFQDVVQVLFQTCHKYSLFVDQIKGDFYIKDTNDCILPFIQEMEEQLANDFPSVTLRYKRLCYAQFADAVSRLNMWKKQETKISTTWQEQVNNDYYALTPKLHFQGSFSGLVYAVETISSIKGKVQGQFKGEANNVKFSGLINGLSMQSGTINGFIDDHLDGTISEGIFTGFCNAKVEADFLATFTLAVLDGSFNGQANGTVCGSMYS